MQHGAFAVKPSSLVVAQGFFLFPVGYGGMYFSIQDVFLYISNAGFFKKIEFFGGKRRDVLLSRRRLSLHMQQGAFAAILGSLAVTPGSYFGLFGGRIWHDVLLSGRCLSPHM